MMFVPSQELLALRDKRTELAIRRIEVESVIAECNRELAHKLKKAKYEEVETRRKNAVGCLLSIQAQQLRTKQRAIRLDKEEYRVYSEGLSI